MIEESIRKFAHENFSDKYFPVIHGETKMIHPLALIVKRHRSFWKRPFAKMEMTIIEGLEKFAKSGGEEAFLTTLNKMISEEKFLIQQKLSMGECYQEFGVDVSGCAEVTLKMHQDLGDLQLGILSQKYISDPHIRSLLADTNLDIQKMVSFEEHELLLITSVIYSEKFEVTGNRMREMELDAGIEFPSIARILVPDASAHYKETIIPHGVAARNVRGPLLFKCCRVDYNKESNRLEIHKGDYVGKTVTTTRETGRPLKEEDGEYDDTVVNLHTDETDFPDFTTKEDAEKLEIIKKAVLVTEQTRAGRKERIRKYLNWFEEALIVDENKLLLEEPLTSEDCQFLRDTSLPCTLNSTVLDLTSLKKEEIQGYAIAFKRLHEAPDEKWNEIEKTFPGSE